MTLGTFVRRSSVPPSSKLLESTSEDTPTSVSAQSDGPSSAPKTNDVASNHETEDLNGQGNASETANVQSNLQGLTLNDDISNSNSLPGVEQSGQDHIEEWIRQTSETALSPEAVADSVPPPPMRDVTSPTFTESSYTYSHAVSWMCVCVHVFLSSEASSNLVHCFQYHDTYVRIGIYLYNVHCDCT